MRRVTVFGEVVVEWLDASEALITGFTNVTNTQEGCFRFSAVIERQDPLNPLRLTVACRTLMNRIS